MVTINVIGRLGADAEVVNGTKGQFVSFRMASNEKRVVDGERKEITSWFKVTLNGDRFLKLAEYLKTPEAREASYIKAKSLLAGSNRADAMKIIVSLAADKTDAYGAEAAYLEILDLYDRGRFAESQTKVYDFSESGSSQNYWLAKSFLVLGDCFVETGDVRQARATFESIRDGYTPASKDDDIPDAVALRLRKLDELSQDAI